MKIAKAIVLVETRTGCAMFEETPRFDVMFRGEEFGQLYFNTHGYTGCLPAPRSDGDPKGDEPIPFTFGEVGIGKVRKIVAGLNAEWEARTP